MVSTSVTALLAGLLTSGLVLTASASRSRSSSSRNNPGYGLSEQVAVPPDDLDTSADPFGNAQEWETLDNEPSPHLMQSSLLQVPCGLQQHIDDHLYSESCKINPVAAFVDTGAQVTVLSKKAAQRAGLLHLLDRRYAGHATGVGQCRVLGRIPAGALLIHMGHSLVPGPAITVLESTGTEGVDLLLGLDFLRDHHAVLSLHEEEMKLFCDTPTPVVIPFARPRNAKNNRGPSLLHDDCTGTNTKSSKRRYIDERERGTGSKNEMDKTADSPNPYPETNQDNSTPYPEQENELSDTDDFFGETAFQERVDLSGV